LASLLPTLRFIATHPLGSRKPFAAFWRYGRWQIESRLRSEVEIDWIEGSKLVARNGMTGATGNIYCGLHEFADMAFLLHLLKPGDLFVDIGANIGSYTVLASAVCEARSISIEPDPGTLKSLTRNVEGNGIGDRVVIVEAALGARRETARFTMGFDTMNRVATSEDAQTREVQVVPLDEILECERPVLIKMDVEGHEPEVITGSPNSLKNTSLLAVIAETVDERMRSALEAAGFQRAVYEPFSRKLQPMSDYACSDSLNALFVRDLETCRRRIETAPFRNVVGLRL
jgi:FkbM family methyltransferase